MNEESLLHLLRVYAHKGIERWSNESPQLKARATRCLGFEIAESPQDVETALYSRFRETDSERLLYIPMPTSSNKIGKAFFLLMQEQKQDGHKSIAFMLFLIVSKLEEPFDERDMCLAFRWEPAEEEPTVHTYAHVQLCRNIAKGRQPHRGIPSWLPDSYPAVPIGASDPTMIFLSMATSVHGFKGGIREILRDLFQNEPLVANQYLSALKSQLMVQ